jgi:hypothetical protein
MYAYRNNSGTLATILPLRMTLLTLATGTTSRVSEPFLFGSDVSTENSACGCVAGNPR